MSGIPQRNDSAGFARAAAAANAAATKRQARLRRRFQAVSRRIDRATRLPRLHRRARAPALAVAGVLMLCLVAVAGSPWPAAVTAKHYLALTGCDAAYLVSLAPAKTGSPGYWRRLDYDHDGKSCEVKPGRHRIGMITPWMFTGRERSRR